jgi:hypothetical protein
MVKKKVRQLNRPPRSLGSARVLHWAAVHASVGFRGRTLLFVDRKELGRVPRLAICEEEKIGVLLLHCNGRWRSLGCSAHKSVAAAKEKAEWIYPGLAEHWRAAK